MNANEFANEIANSPHADALVTAAASFVVAVVGAIFARLSKRWIFLVPVERIARVLIESAVARTEAEVVKMKSASGRNHLSEVQSRSAKASAIMTAEAEADARAGVSLRKTIGDAALGAMVDRAVKQLKTKKAGD
jgi:hypothetical protein